MLTIKCVIHTTKACMTLIKSILPNLKQAVKNDCATISNSYHSNVGNFVQYLDKEN